jgi:hypothetical protein
MRSVVYVGEGVVEVNWLWLPSCIGINTVIQREIESSLAKSVQGMELTEKSLDDIHTMVVTFLCQRFSHIEGLNLYLDALKFVTIKK